AWEALVCGRNLRLKYVELHSASAFSFLEGASRPEDLVSRAKQLEQPAIALVDRDGVYGAPRLHMAAKSVGIQPHVGGEISVEGFGNLARPPSWMPNSFPARPVRLPLLVKSRTGYQNLCRLMTRYKLREKEKGTGTANLDEVAEHAEGLVCLTGGEEGVLAASLSNKGFEDARKDIELLTTIFGRKNVYVEFQRYPVPEGETMDSFLRKRTEEGFQNRYAAKRDDDLFERAKRQVERELALIEKLHLAGYFLIVWDIIRFCREQKILVQGRGSAANSAVCYSLGITAVDPVGMKLLFERFLSEERGKWPDIDLDLPSGDQREKAIQYVYQRYGELGAAMTANVITYRDRSAA